MALVSDELGVAVRQRQVQVVDSGATDGEHGVAVARGEPHVLRGAPALPAEGALSGRIVGVRRVVLLGQERGDLAEAQVDEARQAEGPPRPARPPVGLVDEVALPGRHGDLHVEVTRVARADAHDGLRVLLHIPVDLVAARVGEDQVQVAHPVVGDREHRVALAAVEVDVEVVGLALGEVTARRIPVQLVATGAHVGVEQAEVLVEAGSRRRVRIEDVGALLRLSIAPLLRLSIAPLLLIGDDEQGARARVQARPKRVAARLLGAVVHLGVPCAAHVGQQLGATSVDEEDVGVGRSRPRERIEHVAGAGLQVEVEVARMAQL